MSFDIFIPTLLQGANFGFVGRNCTNITLRVTTEPRSLTVLLFAKQNGEAIYRIDLSELCRPDIDEYWRTNQ